MTKDVLITVSGLQHAIEDEPIELMLRGTYYNRNGKHYVVYDEQPEGEAVTRNMVKFHDGHFEMTKKGGNTSYLTFDRDRKTSSVYQTPAGSLQIDTITHVLDMEETEDEISVYVRYSLDINYNYISECEVRFKVQAR